MQFDYEKLCIIAKVARMTQENVCVGELLVRCSPKNRYLENLLRSKSVLHVVANAPTFGAKKPCADWKFIGNMRLPFYLLAKQAAIVENINNATASMEADINRTGLIADAKLAAKEV